MVALFVLVAGLMGILSLLAQSIFLSKTVENQTIATYLASEGIELAKNLIDHDVYMHDATPSLSFGWGTCFGSGGDFELDYTTKVCPNLPNNQNHFLEYNPTLHRYLYFGNDLTGGGQQTIFQRRIQVSNPSPDTIDVKSIVTWAAGGGQQTVTLEDEFYNWHP